jgi:hypothetical protein
MKDTTVPPAAVKAQRTVWMTWPYALILAVMALTGFGQMPIYNRYYMSDIPGFGWLADFYVTRNIHYLGASVLLALLFYAAVEFLWVGRKQMRLTASGYLRLALLAGIVASGSLIVIKNFPYVHLSDATIIGVNLLHLSLVMAMLSANLACRLMKKPWVEAT